MILIAGILVLALLGRNTGSLSNQLVEIQTHVHAFHLPLTFIRWVAIFLVVAFYHELVNALARKSVVSKTDAQELHQKRTRFTIWLVALELLLGQRLFTLLW